MQGPEQEDFVQEASENNVLARQGLIFGRRGHFFSDASLTRSSCSWLFIWKLLKKKTPVGGIFFRSKRFGP